METALLSKKILDRNGILYPMLVIAAVAVIIFSVLGVATMTGLLPRAESMSSDPRTAARSYTPGNQDTFCGNCGVVEAIAPVEVNGNGSGVGVLAGGITGALLGHQIGRGSGNAVATIAGAAGGAFAGNEIEKNMKKSVRYQVYVRMNDGTLRTTYQSYAPAFAVGAKVKIVNGQIVTVG